MQILAATKWKTFHYTYVINCDENRFLDMEAFLKQSVNQTIGK